ncbi:histidinol-phosphate transaminase [Candidatus Woesearchaeota archaeon]|nr:histidinol-phosphate transaminase [Candidatus Woesearchaeota archaeon]
MIKPRKNIVDMKEYKPPLDGRTRGKYILLDFNERTTPNKPVQRALRKFLKKGKLQCYPEYFDLNKKLARYAGTNTENVMMTNASSEAIDLTIRTFLEKGDEAVIIVPTFTMFEQFLQAQGTKIKRINYDENMDFPFRSLSEKVSKKTKLIIIANPNSPTGTTISKKRIEKILKENKETLILLDEAYSDFSGISCANLVDKYQNLIIVRTFAKAFGLAGLRAGYIISKKENIKQILKIKSPYSVNIFAAAAISCALDEVANVKKYSKQIMKKSKPLLEKFLEKNNIKFYPSRANFLLISLKDSIKAYEFLKKEKVLTRPRGKKYLRISIGTVKETKKLIKIMEKNIDLFK